MTLQNVPNCWLFYAQADLQVLIRVHKSSDTIQPPSSYSSYETSHPQVTAIQF
jgi:hypothetical protein